MRLTDFVKSLFSIFIIFALVLCTEQGFAHGFCTGGATIQLATSTLNAHDDVEMHKAFHQGFMLRNRFKVISRHSPVL